MLQRRSNNGFAPLLPSLKCHCWLLLTILVCSRYVWRVVYCPTSAAKYPPSPLYMWVNSLQQLSCSWLLEGAINHHLEVLSARLISHFRDVLAGGYWRDIQDKNHRVVFPNGFLPRVVFLVVSGHYFNDSSQFERLWHQDQTLVKGKLKRQLITAL